MKEIIEYLVHCRVCGSVDTEEFLRLPQMPMTGDFVPTDGSRVEFKADIPLCVCRNCWTCQTLHNVDFSTYYEDYEYSVGASGTAARFMDSIASHVTSSYFTEGEQLRILEIGSGDGRQLESFRKLGHAVMGYEPSAPLAELARARGIDSICGLFRRESLNDLPATFRHVDIILMSFTLDHIPDPVGAMDCCRKLLDPNRGLLVIENHDLEKIFERGEFCLFEHEHSIYLTAATAQRLLDRCGFDLIAVNPLPEAITRANSLVLVASPKAPVGGRTILSSIGLGYEGAIEWYQNGAETIRTSIARFDSYVSSCVNQGITLAGYGAGGRGVMTLAASRVASSLEYLVDQNPKGEGILAPSSRVPVVGLEHVRIHPVDRIIVFSFGYMEEIQDDLAQRGIPAGALVSIADIWSEKAIA